MVYPLFKTIEAAIDETTKTLAVIDVVHHEIHEGDHYTANYTVTTSTTATVLITNPSTGEYCHIVPFIEVSEKTATHVWTISKAPNASGGTAVSAINNNIGSSNVAKLVVTSTPTFVSAGTILETHYIGAGNNTPFSMRNEWILPPDNLLLIRVSTGANAPVSFNIYWYEE